MPTNRQSSSPLSLSALREPTGDRLVGFSQSNLGMRSLASKEALAECLAQAQAQEDQRVQIAELVRINEQLQQEMEARTAQLQQALEYEAALKRITDRVRDSLDEHQILQNAVQELAVVLNASGCNAALYDLTEGTSTVRYEYTAASPAFQGRVAKMNNAPQLYEQLLKGEYFQFCSLVPHPERGRVAMLACPILDDQGVMGDLWLINQTGYSFSELEIRLVQQAANQCAIAIRQARLYQAAQAQVQMLERLNQLKDDFLSTVSHELRTPMTNMKMGIQMLTMKMERVLETAPPEVARAAADMQVDHYLKILRVECEREINLINDLLDLQQLEQEGHNLPCQVIDLNAWLSRLVDPFYARVQQHQQQLIVQLQPDLPTIFSHAGCLTRILSELLNNACKYTPKAGEITVDIAQKDQALYLQVINTGIEIAPQELNRIFEKFYRVPSSDPWGQPGTGLGLALVQGLVHRLGGHIVATSGAGKTTFRVELPCDRPSPVTDLCRSPGG